MAAAAQPEEDHEMKDKDTPDVTITDMLKNKDYAGNMIGMLLDNKACVAITPGAFMKLTGRVQSTTASFLAIAPIDLFGMGHLEHAVTAALYLLQPASKAIAKFCNYTATRKSCSIKLKNSRKIAFDLVGTKGVCIPDLVAHFFKDEEGIWKDAFGEKLVLIMCMADDD